MEFLIDVVRLSAVSCVIKNQAQPDGLVADRKKSPADVKHQSRVVLRPRRTQRAARRQTDACTLTTEPRGVLRPGADGGGGANLPTLVISNFRPSNVKL